ncbi:MAG: YebC/PmpR family DNA-binding transcriptional regulator [Tissierellia bacterium]|nr:YebC/PmpR family DNA-binding transcriptional regulator [Tissierellia bacterium]
MAGHSKWNNIKRKKGKEDAKKGKIFTKMARNISVAAREGGGDPEFNPSLKVAVDKAKAMNMPNDNIERAIKKGTGEGGEGNFEAITYEGYGPSGVAVMVKCLTDNRNRTAPDVRHAFDKVGGNMGTSGSVSYLFEHRGQLGIEKTDQVDGDQLMLEAIDAGALDFEELEDGFNILTEPEDYLKVRKSLEEAGYDFVISELTYLPTMESKLTDPEDIKNMEKLIELLEDHDDVQEVYHNWEEEE